ncbi:adenosylcobinamide-GDP ribazoletransferase [Vulcanisaeta souniana JCM 11219]|uniref:Adenosylcobinamide-GDP ribazoletransferase n=1 Tax=Vulcanisaeta souniana JCM 11219 TaxID=1293586 RepID=A0A830EIJ0_9CREN|nr:adenosylcobinamide-GDP ribazoletransferase [Vulcanisaeta souniana JCM 11219]GGI79984.1 adenosylcobinamide-GDP ribazoletransferase [Vulcanisaeta souniana JCM 11219]
MVVSLRLRDAINDLRAVITFFTVIPIGGSHDVSSALKSSWFAVIIVPPITGLLPGLLGFYLRDVVHSDLLIASVSYAAVLMLTGLNHIDGFADVIDALMVRGSIEDRIRVLKDPHRGSASIAMVVLLIIIAVSASTNLVSVLWQSLFAAEIVSKASCCLCGLVGREPGYKGLGWLLTRYSKENGHLVITSTVVGFVIIYLLLGTMGVVASLITLVLCLLLFMVIQRVLGGAVGDLYGFTLEVSRALILVILVILMPLLIT